MTLKAPGKVHGPGNGAFFHDIMDYKNTKKWMKRLGIVFLMKKLSDWLKSMSLKLSNMEKKSLENTLSSSQTIPGVGLSSFSMELQQENLSTSSAGLTYRKKTRVIEKVDPHRFTIIGNDGRLYHAVGYYIFEDNWIVPHNKSLLCVETMQLVNVIEAVHITFFEANSLQGRLVTILKADEPLIVGNHYIVIE